MIVAYNFLSARDCYPGPSPWSIAAAVMSSAEAIESAAPENAMDEHMAEWCTPVSPARSLS